MSEHAATGCRVIHASQECFELEIEIFIEAVDEILTGHRHGMTDDVSDRYSEAALDPPGLIEGNPARSLQRQSGDNDAVVFFRVTFQLVLDCFYRRRIAHFRARDFR